MSKNSFIATNHLCHHCGVGTIVQRLNTGPTGGGNPIYECLTCGETCCSMSPHPLCYCGHITKYHEYRCIKKGDKFDDSWLIWKTVYKLWVLIRRNNIPYEIFK